MTFQQSETHYARGVSKRDSGYFTRMSVAHSVDNNGQPATYRSHAARDDRFLDV